MSQVREVCLENIIALGNAQRQSLCNFFSIGLLPKEVSYEVPKIQAIQDVAPPPLPTRTTNSGNISQTPPISDADTVQQLPPIPAKPF